MNADPQPCCQPGQPSRSSIYISLWQIADQNGGVHLPHDPRVHGVQQEDQTDRELCLRKHTRQVSFFPSFYSGNGTTF